MSDLGLLGKAYYKRFAATSKHHMSKMWPQAKKHPQKKSIGQTLKTWLIYY